MSSASSARTDDRKTGSYCHGTAVNTAILPLCGDNTQEENMEQFEDVLQTLTKPVSGLQSIPARRLLEEASKTIANEEEVFEAAAEVSDCSPNVLKTIGGLSLRSTKRGNESSRKGQSVRNPVPSQKQPPAREVQGSAGSSKASSNASDESEESDLLGFGQASCADAAGSGFFPAGGSLALPSAPVLSGLHLLHHTDQGLGLSLHGSSNNLRSLFERQVNEKPESPTEGVMHEHNNARKMSYDTRRNTVPLRDGTTDEPYHRGFDFSSNAFYNLSESKAPGRGGWTSDPSSYGPSASAVYHNKKQGRAKKLEKLTKFQSKKLDRTNRSSEKELEAWDLALKEGASKGSDNFLDVFATELNHQKTVIPKTVFSPKGSPLIEAGTAMRSSPSEGSARFDHDEQRGLRNGVVVQPTDSRSRIHGSARTRKCKLSDSEHDSSRGSDHELSQPRQSSFSALAPSRTSPLNSGLPLASSKLSYSPDGPRLDGMQSWEMDVEMQEQDLADLTRPDMGRPLDGLHRTSSGSSESSVDRTDVTTVPYVRLAEDANEDADVDDGEKADHSLAQVVKAKKKKRNKKPKKKSGLSSKVLPQKPEETPGGDQAIPVLSAGPVKTPEKTTAHLVPVPTKLPTKEVSPKPENDIIADPPSDSEFQVVTRRLPAKTSPTKNHTYPNYTARYPINRSNRQGYPSARTIKQPVAVVAPAPPDFSVLRRRNSAGDLTKGLTDAAPDGQETGGDVSDMDSVRSMPVSKGGKAGGKTTSAPATRLPTPGISYADIAKAGTHSGGAMYHAPFETAPVVGATDKPSPIEPVRRTDSSKSESEKDARIPKLLTGLSSSQFGEATPLVKSVSADRVAVNPKAEGAPHQRLTPNQIISRGADKQNRRNGPGGVAGKEVPTKHESHRPCDATGAVSEIHPKHPGPTSRSAAEMKPDVSRSSPGKARAPLMSVMVQPHTQDVKPTDIRVDSSPPLPPPSAGHAVLPLVVPDYRSAHYLSDRGESTNAHTIELYRAISHIENPCPPLAPRLGPVVYSQGPVVLPPIRERNDERRPGYGMAAPMRDSGMIPRRPPLLPTPEGVVRLDESLRNGRFADSGAAGENLKRRAFIMGHQAEVTGYMENNCDEVRQKALKGVPGYRIFKA